MICKVFIRKLGHRLRVNVIVIEIFKKTKDKYCNLVIRNLEVRIDQIQDKI